RCRRYFDKSIQHLIDAKVIHRRTKKHWSNFPLQIFCGIKIRINSLNQFYIFPELLSITFTDKLIQFRIFYIFKLLTYITKLSLRGGEKSKLMVKQIVNPLEAFAHTNWPGKRTTLNVQLLLHFFDQLIWITSFSVKFVDKADHRSISHPADFH